MMLNSTPQTEAELLERANKIAGITLAELASHCSLTLPNTLLHAKGFIGQLIERFLGATAGNKPQPDFLHLGIELKTLPYSCQFQPQESTYVCTAPLSSSTFVSTSASTSSSNSTSTFDTAENWNWETSRLRRKLEKVLWVPIEADDAIPLSERRIAAPFLFKLKNVPAIEKILKEDWEDLMEMMVLGKVSQLTSHQGQYLQIRPKAAHSRIKVEMIDEEGSLQSVGPKGFYLRTRFTAQLLKNHYCF